LAVFAHGALAFTQPDPTSYHRNGSLAFVDAESGIDLMHVDGRDREPLLQNGGTSPVWSPDGTHIAYVLNGAVRVVNSDGSNDHEVTAGQDPSWTPDGHKLLVSSFGDIVEVPLNGDPSTNLTNTPNVTETEPVESPDGQWIAFTSNEDPNGDPANPTAGQYNNLWITQGDLQGTPQILWEDDAGLYTGHPKWAPDSSRLVFIDNGDVWTTPPDGNNQTNLTNDGPTQDFPAWSPDGTLIAYSQSQAAPLVDNIAPSEIWTIDVNSGMRVNLTHNTQAHDTMPDWQPWLVQNGRLAFLSGNAVWTMDPDGTHRYDLMPGQAPAGTASLRDVQWSPTGTLVAVVNGNGFISVVDPLGEPSLSNQNSAQNALFVSWFPDDQGIAFGGSDQAPNASDQEIYSQEKGSQNTVNLTNTPDIDEFAPAVSPDGSTIAFISDQEPFSDPPTRGNGIGIWTMDFDGNNRQFVTTLQNQNFAFGIGGHPLSWSPDGKQLAYTSGQDVWTIDARDGSNARNLTNDGLLQFDVSWSPDGRLIAFDQGALNSNFQIWTIDPNNGHRSIVSRNNDNLDLVPSWQRVWAPSSDGYFPWGDNNCSGKPQPGSVLPTLQALAGIDVSHVPGCPWIGESGITSTNIPTVWGDTDCTGGLGTGDILAGLEYVVEAGPYDPANVQPVGFSSSCPPIGTYSQWIPTS
jgi:Tol biopolymer transport system component